MYRFSLTNSTKTQKLATICVFVFLCFCAIVANASKMELYI